MPYLPSYQLYKSALSHHKSSRSALFRDHHYFTSVSPSETITSALALGVAIPDRLLHRVSGDSASLSQKVLISQPS